MPHYSEGDIIWAESQSAGRGQRGHSWQSAQGQNLTFSVVLQPVFLPAAEQFSLLQVVALAMVAYFITCNVRLTEMNKSIADAQTQLNTLHSEQVRLQAELAGKTSAEQINNYAQQHGMLPVDSHQIYYVEGNQEDKVTLRQDENNWFKQAWNSLWSFLS